MKTLQVLGLMIFTLSASAQKQYSVDYIIRMWSTADTVALKTSYYLSKIEVQKTEPSLFEQELILQERQFEHEWQMNRIRMIYQGIYLRSYVNNRRMYNRLPYCQQRALRRHIFR